MQVTWSFGQADGIAVPVRLYGSGRTCRLLAPIPHFPRSRPQGVGDRCRAPG